MADESMLSTPGVETLDYTIAEYLNYSMELKKKSDYLNKMDPDQKWNPHKVELAHWAHFVAGQLEPSILSNLPPPEDVPETSDNGHPDKDKEESKTDKQHPSQDDDSVDSFANLSSGEVSNDADYGFADADDSRDNGLEPPAKKCRT